MYIYNKNTLVIVGQIQHNTSFEWEIEHNVIPNFGGVAEYYDLIETNLTRFHLERNESGEVIAVEDGLTIAEQRQMIINQLAELDKIVPRILEDIVVQGDFNLHQSKFDTITQKQGLRQQLQELEVKK